MSETPGVSHRTFVKRAGILGLQVWEDISRRTADKLRADMQPFALQVSRRRRCRRMTRT